MKRTVNHLLLSMLTVALSVAFAIPLVCADNIRRQVWAGRFYESDPSRLGHDIDRLTKKAQQTAIQIPKGKHLRALVIPHAGYIYSGWTAAHAARVLSPRQYAKVILIGPDHRIGLKSAAISNVSAYETPLGRIDLHGDCTKLRQQANLFETLSVTRDNEHSLEVILPFLQRYLVDFQLVPIIVGFGDVARLSTALDSIMDSKTLLVISSDLSHYLPYAEAVGRDRGTIEEIVNLAPDKLIRTDNRACGKTPLLILTQMARRRGWKPLLLHYSNSGDTAGDRSQVVGYAAIAFFGDLPADGKDTSDEFGEVQGQVLVKLARKTIMGKLGMDTSGPAFEKLDATLEDNCFKRHRGTFVTLTIDGQLRGCIGNIAPSEDILHGVRRNAVNAAFHDPRFHPLSKAEMERARIEVSILTEPQPLLFQDGRDLIEKLRIHVDGVIIQKGPARATFLPQAWDQLPRPQDFLAHLCEKAGLSSDAWKKPELNVLTYQIQYFVEEP